MRFLSASAILLSLVLHAMAKGMALLPEMLWVCHVASFLIAIGILFEIPKITAIGFLFHVALGLPGYLLDVMATGTTTVTSALVHTVPLIAGAIDLRQREFPQGVIFPCIMLYLVLVVVCYGITDPALNVNLAHAPWPLMAKKFSQPRIVQYGSSLFGLIGAEWVLRRFFSQTTLDENPKEGTYV